MRRWNTSLSYVPVHPLSQSQASSYSKAMWHLGLFSEFRKAVDSPVTVGCRPGRRTLGLFPEVLDLDLTGTEPHRGEPGGHSQPPETRPPQESCPHTRRSRVPGWGSMDEPVETLSQGRHLPPQRADPQRGACRCLASHSLGTTQGPQVTRCCQPDRREPRAHGASHLLSRAGRPAGRWRPVQAPRLCVLVAVGGEATFRLPLGKKS